MLAHIEDSYSYLSLKSGHYLNLVILDVVLEVFA